MWYSDKPLLQEGLANEIASMLGTLPQRADSVEYFTAFCETISREWTGIDRLRLDKFYMFIKTFVKRVIVFCESCEWEESVVEGIATALDQKIININCTCPDSITVFLAENLYPICSEIEGGLPARAMFQLLIPYVNLLAVTPKRDMTRLLLTHLFNPLCAEDSVISVDKAALSEYIFTLARGKTILTRNRKILYTLKVKLGGEVVIESEIGEKRKRGDEENVSDNVMAEELKKEENMEVVEEVEKKKKKKKTPKKKKTVAEEDVAVSEIISEFVPELVEPVVVEELAVVELEEPIVEPVVEPVVETPAIIELVVSEPIVEEAGPVEAAPVVEVAQVTENGVEEKLKEAPLVGTTELASETVVVEAPVIVTAPVELAASLSAPTELTPKPKKVKTPKSKKKSIPVVSETPAENGTTVVETAEPATELIDTPKPKKAKTPKSKKKKSIEADISFDADKFVEELFDDPEPEALTTEVITPKIKKKKTPKKNLSPVLEITPQPLKKKVRLSMENNTYAVFKKNSSIESPTTYDSTKTPTRSAIRRSSRICASAKKPVYTDSTPTTKTKRRKSVMS